MEFCDFDEAWQNEAFESWAPTTLFAVYSLGFVNALLTRESFFLEVFAPQLTKANSFSRRRLGSCRRRRGEMSARAIHEPVPGYGNAYTD